MQSQGQKESESGLNSNSLRKMNISQVSAWEDAGGPGKERGLFSEVASQRDTNNADKQLAQEDHFHFPHISLQLKVNSQEKKNL